MSNIIEPQDQALPETYIDIFQLREGINSLYCLCHLALGFLSVR